MKLAGVAGVSKNVSCVVFGQRCRRFWRLLTQEAPAACPLVVFETEVSRGRISLRGVVSEGLIRGHCKQTGVGECLGAPQIFQESPGIFPSSFLATQRSRQLRPRNFQLGLPLRELLFIDAARV